MQRNPNCTLCELHQSSRHVCIFGAPTEGTGFIVGEAPGREEARTGKPFQGQAGSLLRPILADYGLADAYITNAAKCRPPENRKPEPAELAACRPYLLGEIEARQPKAILLLGATAMRSMIGKTKITEMNGQVVEKDGRTYVCAFHPAYILRDPSKEPQLRIAIARYASVLQGEGEQSLPEYRVLDARTFDDFLEDWASADQISFDCETTGLDWWVEGFDINLISFSMRTRAGERNWAVPMAKWPILPFELRGEFLRQLARASARKRMVAQNGKFDNLCLMAVFGVRFHLASDTMLAHHIIDENSVHGLKPLSRQFCNAPDYDIPLKEKLHPTSMRRFFNYGVPDAVYTRRLDDVFMPKMDEDDRWIYEKLTMPSARLFEKIEHNGLYVDLSKIAVVEAEQHAALDACEKRLNKIAGKTVNWNAPAQVAEILYGKLGLTPTVFTDKKAPSTGEEALVDIDHPIAKELETYRMHAKFLSTYVGTKQADGTYIGGWRDFMVGPHLYLGTKLHGTVTGRYSSRLHQVPREGTVRNLVIAPPGWTFVQLDLSQAELRVIAIVARDPEMLNCFRTGRDIHWRTLMGAVESGGGDYVEEVFNTAKLITKRKFEFPDALEIVSDLGPDKAIALWNGWKEARKKAKGINFGFVYGQSAQGFIRYAKTKYGFEPTLDESNRFRDGFFHTYHSIESWHKRQIQAVHRDGMVRNLVGRKRHLPGIYSTDRSVVAECERQAINSPIQGFIGDYKAMIMLEIDEAFDENTLRQVGEVHDSVLMWIRTERLKAVLPKLKHVAEHPKLAREAGLKFPIPLTVDIEVGAWGAGIKWKGE